MGISLVILLAQNRAAIVVSPSHIDSAIGPGLTEKLSCTIHNVLALKKLPKIRYDLANDDINKPSNLKTPWITRYWILWATS